MKFQSRNLKGKEVKKLERKNQNEKRKQKENKKRMNELTHLYGEPKCQSRDPKGILLVNVMLTIILKKNEND